MEVYGLDIVNTTTLTQPHKIMLTTAMPEQEKRIRHPLSTTSNRLLKSSYTELHFLSNFINGKPTRNNTPQQANVKSSSTPSNFARQLQKSNVVCFKCGRAEHFSQQCYWNYQQSNWACWPKSSSRSDSGRSKGILCAFRFNTETGPLFCARLLKDSPDKIADIDPEDLDPDLNTATSCSLVFTTVLWMVQHVHSWVFFISMLNDIISNRPINDDEPLGEYFPEDATVKLILRKKEMIESDSCLRDRLIQENEVQKNQKANITQISDKTSTEKRTVTLARVLSQNVTLKFIQKCRQEKVTVNSAFSALVAVALTDTLVEYGLVKDSYSVQNFHLVNLRRYWKNKPPISLGCFWDYVRSLHQLIKDGIESEKVLTDKALHLLTMEGSPYTGKFLVSDKEYEGDFVTSNLGNVTPLVTEGGEHVKISHIIRSTTIHCIQNPVVINLHTFRGKFTMMFDYNSGAVQKDIAEKYCSQILKHLFGILE
ncbi:uncharacterized protein LOC135220311 [Macrobrachium nipponense]|uniref:uncharacterized protein LOC135220311 n=1 Tax=Macrobrachium nipponense TaxID=159736 RepID=UPI0030C847A4